MVGPLAATAARMAGRGAVSAVRYGIKLARGRVGLVVRGTKMVQDRRDQRSTGSSIASQSRYVRQIIGGLPPWFPPLPGMAVSDRGSRRRRRASHEYADKY